jgi:SAM-dependent methyltransferase
LAAKVQGWDMTMNIAERLVEASAHWGRVLATVDGYDVIACEACGFRHIDPLFTDEELKKFYDGEFYEKERPDYFARAEADKEWWMLRYHHYYELLEAHAPNANNRRRILDIGSGPGYFLEAGRERGWMVAGFEPSRIAADYTAARGIAVVNDFFSADAARTHGPFDAVSMNLVLEHLRDPIGLVEQAMSVLAPGGLLFVSSIRWRILSSRAATTSATMLSGANATRNARRSRRRCSAMTRRRCVRSPPPGRRRALAGNSS